MRDQRKYCIIEHMWRLIRAAFLLLGTALWIYTDVNSHSIFACFVAAAIVDQAHGIICHYLEKMLKYPEQHGDWE